jgi:hypothetical protein
MTDDMIPRAGADARVAAVLEAAAQHHDIHADGYSKTCQAADAAAHREHAKRIRALTPDDARATLEAILAEAQRDAVETARQAVWDKLNGSQLAEQL